MSREPPPGWIPYPIGIQEPDENEPIFDEIDLMWPIPSKPSTASSHMAFSQDFFPPNILNSDTQSEERKRTSGVGLSGKSFPGIDTPNSGIKRKRDRADWECIRVLTSTFTFNLNFNPSPPCKNFNLNSSLTLNLDF